MYGAVVKGLQPDKVAVRLVCVSSSHETVISTQLHQYNPESVLLPHPREKPIMLVTYYETERKKHKKKQLSRVHG